MDQETDDPHDVDVYATRRETTFRFINFVTAQGVARLTLNRPPANVLSVEMMEEINAALESLEYQREVKLVILAATGKYFSPGFELPDHLGDRGYMMLEEFRRIFENLAKVDKPTLAVVNGPALGAGSMLAAACDISYAATSAKFGHPEIKGGVFNPVAVALLPRLVGRRRAAEMILGGASVTAAEAERIGLITRAIPDDRLEAEVNLIVQRFQEGSAVVLQLCRRALAGAFDLLLPDAFRHAEDVYLNQLLASEDAEEGLRAIMEKRKPVWKDR
jgi:cyclohexa-1,5-dienecarbonyl-CoA hydratase